MALLTEKPTYDFRRLQIISAVRYILDKVNYVLYAVLGVLNKLIGASIKW